MAAADDALIQSAGVSLPSSTKVTPMLRQWLEAKAKSKDAILLFRMGDFYELFGEDAIKAGDVLDLAVTTRDRDKGDDAMPMAGFPHPQAPVYIARLIAAGMKVAVCDQMEDPALARGIVKRDVTRIVTPGMVLDDESLDARANNFLVAVNGLAICALDVSTGEMIATEVESQSALVEELQRLAPREIVTTEDAHERLQRCAARVEVRHAPKKTRLVDKLGAADPLLGHGALVACEMALGYVEETGQGKLPTHLLPARAYACDAQLLLDPVTRAHLEITGPSGDLRKRGTLLHVVDRTKTAAGGRRLLRMLVAPSADLEVIEARLSRVQSFVDDAGLRGDLRELLTGLPDVERLVARASAGRATPRDLARLRDALRVVPKVQARYAPDLDTVSELSSLLERALVDEPATLGAGAVIAKGYDARLDEIVDLASGGRDRIAALEEEEKSATGIANLKIRYTSVFGFYIEVTKAHLSKVPERYRRKQTVANGERYVTDALQQLEDQVEGADKRRLAREQELVEELMRNVAKHSARLLATAARLAELDAAQALADVAAAERWCRPTLLAKEKRALQIVDGRHPVVEQAVRAQGEPYVPSSVELNAEERQILVVTGPNMAGKSTMMRQVALIQLLAQAGSFVPASSATLSLCDRIFTRVGASDDLAQGRSTFMVEMTETAHILRAATPDSLVLLDEIGRGTATYDGLSIAWAVAEHVHDVTRCRTLFATHYHELTKLAEQLPRLKNVHVVVKEWNDEIVFVRAIADGPAERSYGVQVARLAGLPDALLKRAREVLATLESGEAQKATTQKPQLSLFDAAAKPDPIVEKLRALEVLRMTPLDALNTLARLVEEAKRST